MYYVIIGRNGPEKEIFSDLTDAKAILKQSEGRMKTFKTKEEATKFVNNVEDQDISFSLEKLTINDEPKEKDDFPTPKPAVLAQLRRQIESGDYEEVEKAIWSNPRCLVTVCDSATYLMAGPKYNACHIAARADKAEIMGLLLDTISNYSFLRKLYPNLSDDNVQDRINHLLDSYLNTPDPRLGNTPLHFACKKGFYKVVKVLLTFEGCDLKIKDSDGKTAEESIGGDTAQKIKDLFRIKPHSPLHRDQLKKRLLLTKRLSPSKSPQSPLSQNSTPPSTPK